MSPMIKMSEAIQCNRGPHILLVEDDPAISSALEGLFALKNYAYHSFQDGQEALASIETGKEFDLAVLDLTLPGISGFALTEACAKRNIPVIIITARTDIGSEVKGFELGADDYLIKPFNPLRLITRIERLLGQQVSYSKILVDELFLDLRSKEVVFRGAEINLTPLEFDILAFFMEHPNQCWSKNEIVDAIWGDDYFGDPNTFNVHLHSIRQKLGSNTIIETIGRLGFMMKAKYVQKE